MQKWKPTGYASKEIVIGIHICYRRIYKSCQAIIDKLSTRPNTVAQSQAQGQTYPKLIFSAFAALLVLLPFAGNIGNTIVPAGADSSCISLPIAKVDASGSEIGNVASNVADGLPATKWSSFGKGAWVSVDLGTPARVCYVDVAWYKGNTRQSTFTISYSSDGIAYSPAYLTQSTGNTTAFERYDFADIVARYIKIKVDGNTLNDWSAISEIKVYGDVSAIKDDTRPSITIDEPVGREIKISSPSTVVLHIKGKASDFGSGVKVVEVGSEDSKYTPAKPISPGDWSVWMYSQVFSPGSHEIFVRATDNAGNQQLAIVPLQVSQEPSSAVPVSNPLMQTDRFGIRQLYPTAEGGMEWTSKWDSGKFRQLGNEVDPDDNWFETTHGVGTYTIDGNGTLTASGNFTRMYVHDAANKREWSENLEITLYLKRINETQLVDYSGPQIFARTNHGTDGNEDMNICDDRGYGVLVQTNGRWKLEKESAHNQPNGYIDLPSKKVGNELPKDSSTGIKFVLRNVDNDTEVKLEVYRDITNGLNGGNWEKIYDFTDNGTNFGVGYAACKPGVNPALPLIHSQINAASETTKPMLAVYARNEYATMEYSRFSIREIDPLP